MLVIEDHNEMFGLAWQMRSPAQSFLAFSGIENMIVKRRNFPTD